MPVRRGSNIQYVLYKLFSPERVVEDFGVRAYEGRASFWVVDHKDNLMVAPLDWDEERESLLAMARSSSCSGPWIQRLCGIRCQSSGHTMEKRDCSW